MLHFPSLCSVNGGLYQCIFLLTFLFFLSFFASLFLSFYETQEGINLLGSLGFARTYDLTASRRLKLQAWTSMHNLGLTNVQMLDQHCFLIIIIYNKFDYHATLYNADCFCWVSRILRLYVVSL